jgi:hypothetical protein
VMPSASSSRHRVCHQRLRSRPLLSTRDPWRREVILARRKVLQIRNLVAKRGKHRKVIGPHRMRQREHRNCTSIRARIGPRMAEGRHPEEEAKWEESR